MANPADGAPALGSMANPQIYDAVATTSGFVFGKQLGTGTAAGNAIAYEKAAQAAALAVQDAADYQRNVLSICAVAQGKALAMMFITKTTDPYAEILTLAQAAATAATVVAGAASSAIATSLGEFPTG